MTEKIKYFDRLMSKRDISKFDTTLLPSNDGGKYSPSIRRLRQHYFHDTKSSPDKIFLSSITTTTNDFISSSFKCEECQKHDGLFQCCHCNQRLCIRCCNKHYKKVTNELEHLHELTDRLLTKVFHVKTDLEKQKNQTIEQCHQWRIETINTINKAHTITIQTIHNEYEILRKEYDLFVEKEMSDINMDKNELLKMKKGNLGSLFSSTNTKESKKSMEIIKERIEAFTKRMDDPGKFSFQVKLPKFDIDDTLKVESCFGDSIRSTNALWQNEDFVNAIPSTESEEISKKESSSTPSIEELPSDHHDNTYATASSSTTNSFHRSYDHYSPISTNHFQHRDTHALSFSTPPNENKDTYQNLQYARLNHEHNGLSEGIARHIEPRQKNDDGIIRRRRISTEAYGIRHITTALPIRSPFSTNTDSLGDDYPRIY